MSDYSKKESEIILVEADFSSILQSDEDISSCAVKAYRYGGGGTISEDFDITDAGYASISITVGGETVTHKSYPASGYETARIVLLPSTFAEANIIVASSLDGNGNAVEVRAQSASVLIEGGTPGMTYKVVFEASTNYGNLYIVEKIVAITAD